MVTDRRPPGMDWRPLTRRHHSSTALAAYSSTRPLGLTTNSSAASREMNLCACSQRAPRLPLACRYSVQPLGALNTTTTKVGTSFMVCLLDGDRSVTLAHSFLRAASGRP